MTEAWEFSVANFVISVCCTGFASHKNSP